MQTHFSPEFLRPSVIAVPPLCWNNDGTLNFEANAKMITYLEGAGITTLLYGGNANFFNLSFGEFVTTLDYLAGQASRDTLVIPSVGPFYGQMMDQATALVDREFPLVMVLPTPVAARPAGVETAIRRFVDRCGKRTVLYIKDLHYIEPRRAGELVKDGLVAWIKYAVVRPDPGHDEYLSELCEYVDPSLIVSGMGEQPAVAHLEKFKLANFTSGLVCVAPRRAMQMLYMMRDADFFDAEQFRLWFAEAENLRNTYGPAVVLHHAVAIAGIAETGPHLPLQAGLDASVLAQVKDATWRLLQFEQGDPVPEADQAGEPEQQYIA